MQSTDPIKQPRIVLVGSVSADSLTTYLEPFCQNGKNRAKPGMTGLYMGGGAGNCAQALARINEAFGNPVDISIITELGQPIPGNTTDKISHDVVLSQLQETGIHCIDIARGACAIAFNTVVEHQDGRMIFVQDVNSFPKEIKPNAPEIIEEAIKGADYILLGSAKPHIGVIAARAAKKHGVKIVTDWDMNTWPKDEATAQLCEEILNASDIIMTPSDTVVRGMPDKIENPQDLFQRLQSQYGAKNILMSNGGENVHTLIEGVHHLVPVQAHHGDMFALAAGDHRNAMVLHALAQGCDTLTAFRRGTAFASLKIKYPRFEWMNHVQDVQGFNPIFGRMTADEVLPVHHRHMS